jgi:class 3 adenylate cyclase
MDSSDKKTVVSVPVKYVYLDIVGFTRNRSVEAQSDVIDALNAVVRKTVDACGVPSDQIFLLPTGDGICIALLNVESLYDVHIRIALAILAAIDAHNTTLDDAMRIFQVRIGINSNVDNIITDVNGKKNVAGTGINLAARVMGLADAGQILVGQSVYDTLLNREQYMNAFTAFNAQAKHNLWLPVYQYIRTGHPGLNTEAPAAFRKKDDQVLRLSKHVAFYFAHAIRHRDFLAQQIDRPYASYVSMILLWSLASDSVGYSEETEINPFRARTWGAGKVSIQEQFEYYISQDFWLLVWLSKFIEENHLKRFSRFFDNDQGTWVNIFINHEGTRKLKDEWPSIWKDFEFEFYEV